MPISRFQIDFKNKKAKRGYQWGGKNDSFLIPVRNLQENEEVRYTTETFNHFLKLRKYYTDTEKLKLEGKKFSNKWGRFRYPEETPDELKFMGSIHFIESFIFDLSLNKLPSLNQIASEQFNPRQNGHPTWNFNDVVGTLSISFDWDEEGKKIVPTYHPLNLWEAIKLQLLLTGLDAHNNIIECLHYLTFGMKSGCLQYTTGRSDKKFCSDVCRAAYSDKKRGKSLDKIEKADEINLTDGKFNQLSKIS